MSKVRDGKQHPCAAATSPQLCCASRSTGMIRKIRNTCAAVTVWEAFQTNYFHAKSRLKQMSIRGSSDREIVRPQAPVLTTTTTLFSSRKSHCDLGLPKRGKGIAGREANPYSNPKIGQRARLSRFGCLCSWKLRSDTLFLLLELS